MSNILPRMTARLSLRRLASTDLADFQQYRHDEQVGRYQGWLPQSDPDALAFLEDMSTAEMLRPGIWCQIAIADRNSNALMGDIGVCVSDDAQQAEIGFTLRRQSQGLGLGSEAIRELCAMIFEHTDVRQIIAITDARNTSAIRLLEGLGMQRLQTDKAIFRGQPCKEHLFALTPSR